jgi:transcriptional regulator with XRE-family HTH domain
MSVLSDNLLKLRKHLGMNQTGFGKLFGANVGNIQTWEQDRGQPKGKAVYYICAYFNITPEQLYDKPVNISKLKPADQLKKRSLGNEQLTEYEKTIEELQRLIELQQETIDLQSKLLTRVWRKL